MEGSDDTKRVVAALTPVVEALGGLVVALDESDPADIPIEWCGRPVGAVRLPQLHGSLDRLLAVVEAELGASLVSLTREQQQTAVRRLDDLGAFTLRRAVEDIAGAIGISRITVYNYLNSRYR